MRTLALIVIAMLATAVAVVPGPSTPSPDPVVSPSPAMFAVCPTGEAARRDTTVHLLGGAEGNVTARVFSAGEVVAEETRQIPADGAMIFEVSELTGLARSPVLLGLAEATTRLAAVLTGDVAAASRCDAGFPDTVLVTGGSTSEGETFALLLANPFAGTATVTLGIASEIGAESNPDLERVVVPPRSLVTVDLGGQLPGRQVMSVAVTPQEGRVVAAATQEGSGDAAAIAGQVPNVDWYLPLPDLEDVNRTLVLAAPGTTEVPFQLDVYGPEGLVEAAYEGTVPARGQMVVPVSELLEGEGVVRIVAASPVSAVLRLTGEEVRALIPGVPEAGTSWMLPGAGRLGSTAIHLFNPGEVDVAARVLSDIGTSLEEIDIPAGSWATVEASGNLLGARVEGDGDLIVTWTTATEEGLAGDAAQSTG